MAGIEVGSDVFVRHPEGVWLPGRVTAIAAPAAAGQPVPSPELEQMYRGFERELLVPLWTEIGDLMPLHPNTKAAPHLWRWDRLIALAAQAGLRILLNGGNAVDASIAAPRHRVPRERVPAGSVVVPGNLPSADGSYSLYCAVIVKQVDAKTRAKTSINELLRGD